MTKYHINSNGEPAQCNATERACPLGGEHFDSQREAMEALNTEAETPAMRPLPKDQADRYLKSLKRLPTEEELTAWLKRDNSHKVAALEAALTQFDDEELLLATLQGADLLVPKTYWSDYHGEDRQSGWLVRDGSGNGYGANTLDANGLKQSILTHRRNDRTTLTTAMGMEAEQVTGNELLYSVIAQSIADELSKERAEEVRAAKAARKAAPIDWQKVSLKELRAELGHVYDENDSRHVEFKAALEAVGRRKEDYFSAPGYRKRDEWKNMLIKEVKAHRIRQAQAQAKAEAPATLDWKKTGVQKIAETLGAEYDAALPLHQELKSLVDRTTPAYSGDVYRTPEGKITSSQNRGNYRVGWTEFEKVDSPTPDDLEVMRQKEVASSIKSLFSSWKGDRAQSIKRLKEQLTSED